MNAPMTPTLRVQVALPVVRSRSCGGCGRPERHMNAMVGSEAGALAEDGRDRLAVGLARRLLHHLADEHAAHLLVAALELLEGVGVGGDHLVDGGLEGGRVHRLEAPVSGDRRWVIAL